MIHDFLGDVHKVDDYVVAKSTHILQARLNSN